VRSERTSRAAIDACLAADEQHAPARRLLDGRQGVGEERQLCVALEQASPLGRAHKDFPHGYRTRKRSAFLRQRENRRRRYRPTLVPSSTGSSTAVSAVVRSVRTSRRTSRYELDEPNTSSAQCAQ